MRDAPTRFLPRRPFVAACLSSALSLAAQDGRDAVAAPARERPAPMIVSLAFPGGTLGQFVAAVRQAQPDANIVVVPLAAEVVVPPMEVRRTGLEQALESACLVADGPHEVRVKEFAGPGQPVYTILVNTSRRAEGQARNAATAAAAAQRVFSLNELTRPRGDGLDPLPVATILSAVELAAGEDGKAPLLRYHADSGLLLVRGTPAQVSHAIEALDVLQRDFEARAARQRADRTPTDHAGETPRSR